MSQSQLYKFLNEIDNFHELAGTDDNNDQLNVDVVATVLAAALSSNGTDSLLVDNNQQLDVQQGTLGTVDSGQDTTSAASTEAVLNGGTSLSVPNGATVRVKALSGNGGDVFLGAAGAVSTGSGYQLSPGDACFVAVDDVSDLAIIDGSGGYGVSWIVEQ